MEKLTELVNLFHSNIKQYKSNIYDEANTRTDFIDKFFELLGWDVRNKQGYSENYREVVREDKVVIEGKPKAPDYSFRIGGNRKFFVEAKKPAVNVKNEIEPAYQVRRYGYTAKLPVSILTDFEEFAIYDTRIKPDKNDSASTARIFYCTYLEYEKYLEFIQNTFSKEAILKGSFDKYITENTNKKGTSEIDKELLKLIESWRMDLAKNIALRNPDIDIYNLNTAVQKTIDRIIFLRIAEDRKIENYGELMEAIKTPTFIYSKLNQLFIKADKKYNAGLFKQEEWLSKITIDDKILINIIKNVYYPDCPYEFSILPIEILGNIYEQFLGKTIYFKNVKGGHTAIIEEKPEVRKAGGVYYTPKYIVKYIVENTIGKLINENKYIKILDPACGSGSFLVEAYNYLLEHYLQYYTKTENIQQAKKQNKIYEHQQKHKLTIQEKQNILTNCIYGVDIDKQATEVSKLSLYLKLLEDETSEQADNLFKYTDLKLLPSLENNIKCGNSLIESDFYQDKNIALFDIDQIRKINVFDWKKEFNEIIEKGGFDVVIGNPPWGADIDTQTEYFAKKYPNSTQKHKDTYKIFIDKALQLIKENGKFGFVVPNTFLYQPRYQDIKEIINQKQNYVLNLGENIFQNVNLPSCILIIENSGVSLDQKGLRDLSGLQTSQNFVIDLTKEKRDELKNIIETVDIKAELEKQDKTKIKIKNTNITFENVFLMKDAGINYQRVGTGMQEKGNSDLGQKLLYEGQKGNDNDIQFWKGNDINRYYISPKTNRFVKIETIKNLKTNERVVLNKNYFELTPKIIWRQTASNIIATIDNRGIWFGRSIQSAIIKESYKDVLDIYFCLAIFNSKYIDYIYRSIVLESGRIFPQVKLKYLKDLPFVMPDKLQHDNIVMLVKQMLEVQELYHNCNIESDKKFYKQKIDTIDYQIDKLVFEIYGLSEEERKVVGGF